MALLVKGLLRIEIPLLLFTVCLTGSASGQYHFDSWTTENGLPHNTINSILQTHDGYLWLASLDGLIRYDGVRFTIFNRSNTPGMKSSRCTSLYEDKNGTLWIGTEDSGLVRHDGTTFATFSIEQGLPGRNVRQIWADHLGQTITYIGSGFYIWDGSRAIPYDLPTGNPQFFISSRQHSGMVWYSDASGIHIISEKGIISLGAQDGLPMSKVSTVYRDREGTLWIGFLEGELARFKDGKLTLLTARDGLPESEIRVITEDKLGNLWLAIGDYGLFLYKDGHFANQPVADKPPQNSVLSIYEDKEGTTWFGTATHGLGRINVNTIRVYSEQDGLPANNIYPIFEDKTGSIWLGTWPKGLTRYADGKFTLYSNKDRSMADVTALAEDLNGDLIVGAYNGLARFRNGTFTSIKDRLGAAVNYVSAIYPDKDGAIWVGSDAGVFRTKDGATVRFTPREGLAGDDVKVILKDHTGALWVGCYGGLSRYQNGQWQTFREENGLAGEKVRSLYEDRDGVLWVGTYDGGLTRIKNGKLSPITTKDGLYNNGVFQILEDDRDYFWFSCNLGIYRVSKQQLNDFADGKVKFITSVAYGSHDGLNNIECNGGTQPAGIKARDGRLWFPTQGGVAVIDPINIPVNPQPPPVVIENCVLDRQAVDCRQGIRVSPGQQNLEIGYTGLSFIKPEQVRFKYKLSGLDDDWIDVGTRRTAYFSHLPPGEYTFTVIAANSDGVWNTTGSSIRVVIFAPFWRTWWFATIVVAAVLILAGLIYQQRVLKLQHERAAQEEFSRRLIESQESERKRIAAELHDSLGQSLAIIKNHALFGLQGPADLELTREQLKQISDHSGHAIDEVKEISYNLRPYLLDRLGLTKAIESMLGRVAEASGIDFSVELDNVDGIFPPDEEINFYRIIQESVNNIVKHSCAGSAAIKLKIENSAIRVTIQDNGRGFSPTSVEARPGFGLIGIAERVRMLGGRHIIDSTPGQGTSIAIVIDLNH
ncbi:MAG TPA: two-component regulator propeller domain-containing protein [Blastocatellia bacterium]|nr:two-component regulator propeller domain-containing protein [Blastocatellia bacterium]